MDFRLWPITLLAVLYYTNIPSVWFAFLYMGVCVCVCGVFTVWLRGLVLCVSVDLFIQTVVAAILLTRYVRTHLNSKPTQARTKCKLV